MNHTESMKNPSSFDQQDDFWLVTWTRGGALGSTVVYEHPVDWLAEQFEVSGKADVALVSFYPITQSQAARLVSAVRR